MIIGVIGRAEGVGGAERAFLQLMEGFRHLLGAQVMVGSHLAPEDAVAGRDLYVLRPRGEPPGPRMILRLRRLLVGAPPKAVLFPFQLRSNVIATLANALLPPGRRLPVVLNDRANIDVMTAPTAPGALAILRALLLRSLARACYRRAAHVVCNSAANAERVRAFIGRPVPPISTIPNALDAAAIQARFPARDRSRLLSSEGPLLTAHGRLDTAQKGWDTLLAAFARVRAARPTTRLRIVGDGPDRAALQALAARVGVADAIEWPGYTADPLPAIEPGDVYVFTSRWEGLPNALLEAVALGLPVVATDCPTGPAEILGGEVPCGRLVPVDAVDALAAGVLDLLADGSSRANLSHCARQRAHAFSLESAVAAYARIFLTVTRRAADAC